MIDRMWGENMLNDNDLISAVTGAIKQSVENDYEKYKKHCIEDLEKYLDRQKNNVVQNIMDGIAFSVHKDSVRNQINVQINVTK